MSGLRDPIRLPTVATHAGERLASYPPAELWDDWTDWDPKEWPRKIARRYMLVPTVCFNCESACGLLAWIDRETLEVRKFEGNPAHPGSRGRNCAKGPATLNQVNDPDRILYPMKRAGRRGEGRWTRTTWKEALEDIGGRIRRAFQEGRRDEVMYHVGRPGHDGLMEWVLPAWGIDGHNSHTNICSAGARTGYAFWMGFDRPSPDYSGARVILLISSHLETGHYFNPHAQRILEGKMSGAKLIVWDTRLSNTASMADTWISPWPGSEAAILLAIARHLLTTGRYDREFVRRWVNWEDTLRRERPEDPIDFEQFERFLKEHYARYTFEFAARESGVEEAILRSIAEDVAGCGGRLAAHVWRSAAAGNLGGWQVARCLWLVNILTGSVGRPGGTSANAWDKWVPRPPHLAPHVERWNELAWPEEYPLSHFEMSFLLPHFLKEGRGKLDVYFTRVYNPAWTNPDGSSWLQVLRDESKIGLHVALTPTWNETAWWADYVLPMGHGSERHDVMSQETHAGQWIAFRQPVRRAAMERLGHKVRRSWEANPGQVWEETEFWIDLSWSIDPDGGLGIRKYFESPYRPGEPMTVDDYYGWMFENSVPGLPEAAAKENLTPLAYMRKYGAFEVRCGAEAEFERLLPEEELAAARFDQSTGILYSSAPAGAVKNIVPVPAPASGPLGRAIGVMVDGQARSGFRTPSRRLELHSATLAEFGWPELALPEYVESHVHPGRIDRGAGEFVLLSTYRLPTLIHTRSGNAKWLLEISHANPTWIHTEDARRLGVDSGDLVRIETEIGYFVDRVWVTEGIRPGIIACSHHLGRWRTADADGVSRLASARVELSDNDGGWKLRQTGGVGPYASKDPDTSRIWWTEAGVHQNLTFPVQPDPVSGSHCWHQKVRVARARTEDRYGDISVDTHKSEEAFRRWLAKARPPSGEWRRPYWMLRPMRPAASAYRRPAAAR
ncbi:MAG TPA: molybdopterin dinucleotide binding domain-containing protein [Thermoanaerobaculia bacterium]|nr:molybdopterin dinucleotide binding domain-containing protein [Thermoanaerobaculia bacterium]